MRRFRHSHPSGTAWCAALVITAVLWSPSAAEAEPTNGYQRPDHDTTVYAGTALVSRYVARGIVFADGASFQPWVEFDVPVLKERFGDSLAPRLRFGNWNSVNLGDSDTGRPQGGLEENLRHWYETDVYAGVSLSLTERMSGTLTYFVYSSPSDSFSTSTDLEARINYADADFWPWRGFALNPALRVTRELRRPTGSGRWYYQPSLTPSLSFGNRPYTLQVPLVAGFSPDDWYVDAQGNTISRGFFQTGLSLGIPFDAWSIAWSATAAVDAYLPDSDARNGFDDSVELVWRIGLSTAF